MREILVAEVKYKVMRLLVYDRVLYGRQIAKKSRYTLACAGARGARGAHGARCPFLKKKVYMSVILHIFG